MSDDGQGVASGGDGADGAGEHLEELPEEESRDGFVYFRMTGGRFDEGKGLPAAAAGELQRYAELVYEVARLQWLEAHPERAAVRGLRDAFNLRLVDFKEGSTRPIFELHVRYDPRVTEGDPEPFFLRARDIVNETIATVAVDGVVPPIFPRKALPQLKRIGKGLGADEAIALARPRSATEVREPETEAILTPRVKDILQLIDETLAENSAWSSATGVVTEFDGAKGTFRLDLTEGRTIVCHLGAQEREVAEAIKDVLAADGVTAPDVTVGGTAERGAGGKLVRLWDVNEVAVVRTAEEKAIMARLSELGELQPGWWGPGTRAPGQAAIRNARDLAPRLALAVQRVAIGADGDGSIVLEWKRDAARCSAEIQADGDMYLFAYDTTTRQYREHEGPFDAERVIRFVETGLLDV